jgi:hypothetical protein
MKMRQIGIIVIVSALLLSATVAYSQRSQVQLRAFLNEIQPGVMSSQQYCLLVFDDHHFHVEKTNIKDQQATDRKVSEGQLSDKDWSALVAIIDSQKFRDLKVPQSVPPLVMQDTHPYTISIARDKNFQNMEFLDAKSMKPYEAEVKPLLQWWKAVRSKRMDSKPLDSDSRCTLDNSHAIFAQ